MPAISEAASTAAPVPLPPAVAPVKPERSRLVTFVGIGLVVGLALLVIMIVIAIIVWKYSG
jgi:hypothetical protein